MSTQSDTPRTESALLPKYEDGSGNRLEYVKADFARTLERELNEANEALKLKSPAFEGSSAFVRLFKKVSQEAEQLRTQLAEERKLGQVLCGDLQDCQQSHQ